MLKEIQILYGGLCNMLIEKPRRVVGPEINLVHEIKRFVIKM